MVIECRPPRLSEARGGEMVTGISFASPDSNSTMGKAVETHPEGIPSTKRRSVSGSGPLFLACSVKVVLLPGATETWADSSSMATSEGSVSDFTVRVTLISVNCSGCCRLVARMVRLYSPVSAFPNAGASMIRLVSFCSPGVRLTIGSEEETQKGEKSYEEAFEDEKKKKRSK